MRIALLMNLAPRKLGSFEAWLLALCKEALWRGHRMELFGRAPVHPTFLGDLRGLGVPYHSLEALEASPVRSALRLGSDFDVLHLNMVAPRSRTALIAYGAVPAKVLFVAHSHHLPAAGPRSPAHRALSRGLDRLTLLRVEELAGVSDFVRERERVRFGVPRARTRTLYNGVDPARYRAPAAVIHPSRPPHLLTVAYMMRHKGVHHLLNAFSRLSRTDATLTLVGDGPEEWRLRELCARRGIERRVRFVGLRDDVPALLASADIFVHTSRVEAFGFTIAEAMAAGRPVVASRVGGVPELIEDGRHGLLVPPGNEPELTRSLERLLADPALAAELGEAARQRVRERFSLTASAVAHLEWSEEVGARGRKRARAPGEAGIPVPELAPTPWPSAAGPGMVDEVPRPGAPAGPSKPAAEADGGQAPDRATASA